ncbi:metal-dependent hydrolase [Paenibacillus sp. GSMTC-2017]|uniref:metal-dependent hydrolase n=1 Tax=Paenibacillus sp. GSMTC-2017 TaxID=2794350 RepID=UPI0018D95093|nr:metal-dependent hydrolase [Paenibacillus sp. GSMTC-2017]MBH5319090.1 metal-dependent hydrolase [Paenibacillus sp. GSMTC-2017]
MTGKTHLAIGAAVGAASAIYFSHDLVNIALFASVAGFSALCADLDGPSMLTSKITKLSKQIREFSLWAGVVYLILIAYFFLSDKYISPIIAGGGFAAVLVGLVMKQGFVRNALVSLVGLYLIYHGLSHDQTWLMGLGLFVGWAPWLAHRGMTHTIWIIPFWGWIGWGLEQELAVNGLAVTAMLGYVSHLVADTLTPSGVKWLYPLTKKSFKLKL